MNDNKLSAEEVRQAVKQGGSIRQAAKLLNRSYTTLQWWLVTNRYEVKKVTTATLVKIDDSSKR